MDMRAVGVEVLMCWMRSFGGGTDKNGFKCKAGIYYVVLDNKTYSQKIVLTN